MVNIEEAGRRERGGGGVLEDGHGNVTDVHELGRRGGGMSGGNNLVQHEDLSTPSL